MYLVIFAMKISLFLVSKKRKKKRKKEEKNKETINK
jgi:hypothetical protein